MFSCQFRIRVLWNFICDKNLCLYHLFLSRCSRQDGSEDTSHHSGVNGWNQLSKCCCSCGQVRLWISNTGVVLYGFCFAGRSYVVHRCIHVCLCFYFEVRVTLPEWVFDWGQLPEFVKYLPWLLLNILFLFCMSYAYCSLQDFHEFIAAGWWCYW